MIVRKSYLIKIYLLIKYDSKLKQCLSKKHQTEQGLMQELLITNMKLLFK